MNKKSQLLMGLAFVSLVYAVYLWFGGNKEGGLFVGLWVPSLISLATYLKK